MEFELLDTGIFDDDRYFDIVDRVRQGGRPKTSASASRRSTAGHAIAALHLLPHLWFRNTWAWGRERQRPPVIRRSVHGKNWQSLVADDTGTTPLPNLLFEYRLGPRLPVRRRQADGRSSPTTRRNA